MDGQAQAVVVHRRRSQAEMQRVVTEYEASGLSCVAFCQQKGLSLATLARYRKRQAQGGAAPGGRWVAVEVSNHDLPETGTGSGLRVALAGGRLIEVGRGFDTHTLMQLVGVLERI